MHAHKSEVCRVNSHSDCEQLQHSKTLIRQSNSDFMTMPENNTLHSSRALKSKILVGGIGAIYRWDWCYAGGIAIISSKNEKIVGYLGGMGPFTQLNPM